MKTILKPTAIVLSTMIFIGSTVFVSCEDDSTSAIMANERNIVVPEKITDVKLKLTGSERNAVAKNLAVMLGKKPESIKDINGAIDVVTSYGLDEYLKIYDIYNTEKSVFLPSTFQIPFLQTVMNESNPFSKYGITEDDYFCDLQLYWPYHDKWDKHSMPVICFAPEDDSVKNVQGFLYMNGKVTSVTVNAKKIDNVLFPVIIINQSETSYKQYPNFKDGEREKDGIIWAKPMDITSHTPVEDHSTTDNKVYEARSLQLTSSGTQWDYVWAGGSEFELQSIYTTDASHIQFSAKARVEFSREEIKNKVTKNLETQLHSDWQPGLGDIHLRFIELDEWGIIEPFEIKLNVLDSTLSTTIYINSTDDTIFSNKYTRSNYFNRCNNYDGVFYLGSEKLDCMLDIYDNYGD